jgi:hypothetical protein
MMLQLINELNSALAKADTGEKQCNLPVVRRSVFNEVYDMWVAFGDETEFISWLNNKC